ncbi:MAG: hypothetical protein ACJAZW_001678 [Maritalea sp.]
MSSSEEHGKDKSGATAANECTMAYKIELTSNEQTMTYAFEGPLSEISAQRPFYLAEGITDADRANFPATVITLKDGGRPDRRKAEDMQAPPTSVFGNRIGPWFMNREIKQKMEELEPNTHEFLPVDVVSEDRQVEFGRYYYVVISQKLDALDYDQTQFVGGTGYEAGVRNKFITRTQTSKCPFPIVLKQSAIAGKHLWRGPDRQGIYYYCSDELRQFFLDNKLTGWDFERTAINPEL